MGGNSRRPIPPPKVQKPEPPQKPPKTLPGWIDLEDEVFGKKPTPKNPKVDE